MVAEVGTPCRVIEQVPAHAVDALHRAGALPPLPPGLEAASGRSEGRDATAAEMAALTWTLAFHVPTDRVTGVLATRLVFDYHTSTDRIEVVHIAGSRRAVVALLQHVRLEAEAAGLHRPIGRIDNCNVAFLDLAKRLGWIVTTLGIG